MKIGNKTPSVPVLGHSGTSGCPIPGLELLAYKEVSTVNKAESQQIQQGPMESMTSAMGQRLCFLFSQPFLL